MKRIESCPKVRPEWAKDLIVAEYEIDKSDMMTDYFATTTTTVIALAWSKHSRDLFPEMRKAAALFPPTAHMGPGCGKYVCRVNIVSPDRFLSGGGCTYAGAMSPWHSECYPDGSDQFGGVVFTRRAEAERFIAEAVQPHPINCGGVLVSFAWQIGEQEIEHREKYSMGHGYYLKAGLRYGSGWVVRKYGSYRGAVELGEVVRFLSCGCVEDFCRCSQVSSSHDNFQFTGGEVSA